MTYERVLEEIQKPNGDLARRLLQCLVVAVRPLGVKELAEVLAVDFDDAEGIPKLKPNWRWEDQEKALLTSCSSLITIVETEDSRVVQFSHFSVKEFLTSKRLATSSGGISRYHIDLEPAHTILAQACMGVLLQPDDCVEANDTGRRSPLAGYAAEHWVTHAQFERVSSFLRMAMEHLFDVDKPYFAAWVQLHDIDTRSNHSSLYWFAVETKTGTTPLYYAALCGFQDLVEHLVVKYPQHVNTRGGHYMTPLFAAMAGRHLQTVKLLRHNGAEVNVHRDDGETPLHSAAWYGDLELVRILLDYNVDVYALNLGNWTAIHEVSHGPFSDFPVTPHYGPRLLPDVTRLLLEHGADINAWVKDSRTPLHVAVENRMVEVVRMLHEHGANIGVEDDAGRTPLHLAASYGSVQTMHVLLEYGANIGANNNEGRTPLQLAVVKKAGWLEVEVVRVLLEHGANVGAEDDGGCTPLHLAANYGKAKVVRVLLKHGANIGAKNNKGRTPLHLAVVKKAGWREVEVVRVLLEHGANVGAEDDESFTPLHRAANYGKAEVVRVLLEHGANVGAEDNQGRTAFQIASTNGYSKIMELLSEHGAKGVL